jgi:hypothetical protein
MLVEVESIDVLDRMMIRRKMKKDSMHSVWSFVVQIFVRFCLYRCRYEVIGVRSGSRKNVCL